MVNKSVGGYLDKSAAVDSIMMVGNKSKNLDAVHLIYFFLKFKSS
jgi:hypothetical protein